MTSMRGRSCTRLLAWARRWFCIAFLCAEGALVSSCAQAGEMTQSRALELASLQIERWERSGVDFDGFSSVEVRPHDTPENECLARKPPKQELWDAYIAELREKLRGKKYYAVIYIGPEDSVGISWHYCMFIDRETENVVAYGQF